MREHLETLEEQLLDLETPKKLALFIVTPLILTGLFFYFFIDNQLSQIEEKKHKIITLEQKIHKDGPKMYMKRIAKIKQNIKQNKTVIDSEKGKKFALARKLKNIRFLFSNERDFNIFLETLLKKSVIYNFTITTLAIANENKKYIGMLDIKKSIHLKGRGDFINTLSFIRGVEDNKMLISVKRFNIETNGSLPQTDLFIEFYGVKE